MDILQNDIVRLRAPEFSDIDLIYEWENNPEVWLVSDTITPFSKYILKKYLENAHLDLYQTRQLRLMIEVKNTQEVIYPTIGTIDLFDFDPYHRRAGIGVLIADKQYRRQGYALISLNLFLFYCFSVLSLHQVYCTIPADNESSINLFKKAGFIQIGLKKEWIKISNGWLDEYLFQKLNPYNHS